MNRATDARSAALPATGIGWRHPHHGPLLEQRPALDFIEVHSENFFAPGGASRAVLRQARALYPVSLHGVGLSLGSAMGIDPWHLDQLAALVADIEPIRVSDHACFARAPLGLVADAVHAADLLPMPFTREALDVFSANVSRVQDRLKRPIAVENISAYLRASNDEMDEAGFLVALARRTGCALLVDVNNLYVNALNDQRQGRSDDPLDSAHRWLDAIAPDTVAELHLAGHVDCGDIVIDDHGSRVVPPVWALYQHALVRFGAVPTLIEWDTDVPPLQVLLDEASTARDHAGQALETAAA